MLLAAEDIHKARIALAEVDPHLASLHEAIPPFVWRRRPLGFEGLMRLLIEQQISVAAAAAIWARLEVLLGEVSPTQLALASDDALRAVGFSAAKVRHARSLADATLRRAIDFDDIPNRSDVDALAALTALSGVGPWTAQVYLMMCEGRSDIFPVGDIALKEAVRLAYREPVRMSDRQLNARAVLWRPHRGVAAHLLWAYYLAVKKGEIASPVTAKAD